MRYSIVQDRQGFPPTAAVLSFFDNTGLQVIEEKLDAWRPPATRRPQIRTASISEEL